MTVPGPPVVMIHQDDTTIGSGVNLTLSGAASDPDGGDVTYSWTASNPSSVIDNSVFSGLRTGASVTFNAMTEGEWIVVPTATDDEGDRSIAAVRLTVVARALSSDATLRALLVTDGSGTALPLRPAFSSRTRAYEVTAGNAVTSVRVTATASHAGASVSGSLTRAGGAAERGR